LFSAQSVTTMAFKLCQCAQKRWIRLTTHNAWQKSLEE